MPVDEIVVRNHCELSRPNNATPSFIATACTLSRPAISNVSACHAPPLKRVIATPPESARPATITPPFASGNAPMRLFAVSAPSTGPCHCVAIATGSESPPPPQPLSANVATIRAVHERRHNFIGEFNPRLRKDTLI